MNQHYENKAIIKAIIRGCGCLRSRKSNFNACVLSFEQESIQVVGQSSLPLTHWELKKINFL